MKIVVDLWAMPCEAHCYVEAKTRIARYSENLQREKGYIWAPNAS